jgi:hypothetical protein
MPTATKAYHQAQAGKYVIGWKLDDAERVALLVRFPPRYAKVLADHVTLRDHVHASATLPPPAQGLIVGHVDDGAGVEAMVVEVEGSAGRPDGGTYHITWSLGPGRTAIESNTAIAQVGARPLAASLPVKLQPARFP